ncbi:nucleotide-binding alpha-beta plait domain-containing protein [Tanacetum coccineum]
MTSGMMSVKVHEWCLVCYDKPLRPADMLLYFWDGGLDVCVDLTGSSPLTQTGMVDFVPGRAVIDVAQRKRGKYMAKCAAIGYGFFPFSFSSLGELEAYAVTLLKRIRKFSMAQDIRARAAVHIFNRISFAIAKDELAKLSSSIFVTNFPDKFSAKELWTICKQYGTVVDAFNPDKRSKAGKRFGFVRFIKIFNVDRLVNNLCTIWVGRFKLHANIARFQRPPLNKNNSQSSHNKGDQSAPKDFYKESRENVNSKSYAHVVNAGPHQFHKKEDSPAIVLDETYANKTGYSLALLGKVNDFTSLTNLNVVLANEGFVNVKLKYIGGFWVMIVFTSKGAKETFRSKSKNTFSRITSKWEELLDFDEQEDGNLHSKRVCIKTTLVENIYESFKVIIQGKTFWIRAKEVSGWMPDFEEDIDQDSK